MKQHTTEKAALIADQIREEAGQAAQLVRDKTPDSLLKKAGQAATVARGNRTPLLIVGAVIITVVLVRRSRRRHR
ncbi:hypothetical protein ACFWC9_29410 [Streptomyces goshikiensis]|uniref:hypothetical protein n=1 Tax=Streptomyces goshikiensis TaxID=1942 RepID=UPI003695DB7A